MNQIIDGKKFSQALRDKVKNCVDLIKEKKVITPGLAVILVVRTPQVRYMLEIKESKP